LKEKKNSKSIGIINLITGTDRNHKYATR